jgi:hypothetical protein
MFFVCVFCTQILWGISWIQETTAGNITNKSGNQYDIGCGTINGPIGCHTKVQAYGAIWCYVGSDRCFQ